MRGDFVDDRAEAGVGSKQENEAAKRCAACGQSSSRITN
jgi:hypothetical protein